MKNNLSEFTIRIFFVLLMIGLLIFLIMSFNSSVVDECELGKTNHSVSVIKKSAIYECNVYDLTYGEMPLDSFLEIYPKYKNGEDKK